MTVSLIGPATGSTFSGHDALYVYPADMQHNGTLITGNGADVGLPRITLADAATQRVKWVWAIPPRWAAIAVRWSAIPEVGTGGNVKWQFAYKLIYLGEGNVDGAMTTVSVAALDASGAQDWKYLTPAEVASIDTPTGGFGDAPFMLCSLSRLGADGTDTLAGGVSVGVATATRADL
jgi:hypothetical protein